jgi:hypothetical protein
MKHAFLLVAAIGLMGFTSADYTYKVVQEPESLKIDCNRLYAPFNSLSACHDLKDFRLWCKMSSGKVLADIEREGKKKYSYLVLYCSFANGKKYHAQIGYITD